MKQDPANKGQSILHGQRVFGLTKPERWMVLDYNLFLNVSLLDVGRQTSLSST